MLGGPGNFIAESRTLLPKAELVRAAAPSRAGYVTGIDTRAVGLAVVELGGGRARAADSIDPAVGLTELAGLGAQVSASAPLALLHARDEARAARAIATLQAAYQIGDAPPDPTPSVLARIGGRAP